MKMLARLAVLVSLLAPAAGCSSFALDAPEHFVKLEEPDWSDYAMRAVNADGVVLAVRENDNEAAQGSLTFWTDAVKNRLRTVRGYALLEEKPLRAASGEEGHQLRLGRDEGSQAYDYWVTIFVTDDHVHVVEAGGRREEFARVKDAVAAAIERFEVRWAPLD
jgi:hypothetical protein